MFSVFSFCFAAITGMGYLLLMLRYTLGWKKMPKFLPASDYIPKTKISVIIAARNEAANIVDCLKSIAAQHYPPSLYEIILVDDHSEDNTVESAQSLYISNLNIIEMTLFKDIPVVSYKKKALETAIAAAAGDLIVCTDADCVASPAWLSSLAELYEKNKSVKLIAGPVVFHKESSLFERFQSLDFLGMMAITGAGITGKYLFMCNGANLAYSRAVFQEVGGFEGINNLASGDDMLLMQKIAAKYPDGIRFLKSRESIISTRAEKKLSAFWHQRIRWASKSGAYKQWGTQIQLGMVWLFMLSILLSGLMTFWNSMFFFVFLVQWLLKAISDYMLLREATLFFKRTELLGIFFPALFLHWLYILTVGFWANLKLGYRWKGRSSV